jgi:RimJ/RimL family protein N-acetyltransferase
MKVMIETERLVLRPLVPEDYEAVYKWGSDPIVNEYMIYPLYKNAEDVKSWLLSRNSDDPDSYDLGIALKETGELIGSGGFVYHPERDAWEVGYNIRRDQWGKGYVPEAMQGILDHIKEHRTVRAIEGTFAKENHKSQRVMEKLGMHYLEDTEFQKLDGSRKYDAKTFIREF